MSERVNGISSKPRVLVIDDDAAILDGCSQALAKAGCRPECADNAETGLAMALTDLYDAVLLDLRMPKVDGLEILHTIKREKKIRAKVIIITGYGTIALAVTAMKAGADDLLTKPFSPAELRKALKNVLERAEVVDSSGLLAQLIGDSDYMRELKDTIRRVASTESTVLIAGESGTGKELVAQTIHALSGRAAKPFIPVDCSSLVETIMESELFGHVKGAFTGATQAREGRFQLANGGTLFLDEISNVSLNIQAKLLRVIQEQEVPRVGSSRSEKVDVRLLAATNRDLRREIEAGRFREDLFYRISVVPIEIKGLREHKSDILPISYHYLSIFRKKYGSRVTTLSEEAKKSLVSYGWPGNVRELKNTMERLCVLSDSEMVLQSDILYYGQNEGAKAPVVDSLSGRMTLVDVEREHIMKALKHFNFQINKTAQFLGIDRKTLRMKIKAYDIAVEKQE
ncbi:MAG: sigma-54-dependent Fis family transcriptional regulator [Deltaproteobacteria bacterium]|nr:sigma-54-dependent Fis family transcriptional regulator [Deltaproteobacteria bacterium]